MRALVALVLSVGLVDSLNPSTVGPAVYLATRKYALRSLLGFTLGVFAVNVAAGLVLTLGPGQAILAAVPNVGEHTKHFDRGLPRPGGTRARLPPLAPPPPHRPRGHTEEDSRTRLLACPRSGNLAGQPPDSVPLLRGDRGDHRLREQPGHSVQPHRPLQPRRRNPPARNPGARHPPGQARQHRPRLYAHEARSLVTDPDPARRPALRRGAAATRGNRASHRLTSSPRT